MILTLIAGCALAIAVIVGLLLRLVRVSADQGDGTTGNETEADRRYITRVQDGDNHFEI